MLFNVLIPATRSDSPSVSLSLCQPVFLSVCLTFLSLCLTFLYLCLSLCLSHVSVCLSVHLSVCPTFLSLCPTFLSLCLSLCLSHVSVSLSISLSGSRFCLPVYLSLCLFHVSVSLSIYLSVSQSLRLISFRHSSVTAAMQNSGARQEGRQTYVTYDNTWDHFKQTNRLKCLYMLQAVRHSISVPRATESLGRDE